MSTKYQLLLTRFGQNFKVRFHSATSTFHLLPDVQIVVRPGSLSVRNYSSWQNLFGKKSLPFVLNWINMAKLKHFCLEISAFKCHTNIFNTFNTSSCKPYQANVSDLCTVLVEESVPTQVKVVNLATKPNPTHSLQLLLCEFLHLEPIRQSCKNMFMVPQAWFLVTTWFLKMCRKFSQNALSNWLINSLFPIHLG